MRITVESVSGGMEVKASVDIPDVEASAEDLEWLANTFKDIVESGVLGKR